MEKTTNYSNGSIIPCEQDGGTSCWFLHERLYSNTDLTRNDTDGIRRVTTKEFIYLVLPTYEEK